jgi:hypothetical protein
MKYGAKEPRGAVYYQSPAVSWEVFPTGHAKALIHRIRFIGGTIFFVTDRSGRNFNLCADEEDCYRIIEETFPWSMLDGKRSNGAVEIFHRSLALTAPV